MSKRKIRVMSVDDHVFLVEGLKARFSAEPDIEFVGQLATADNLAEEAERNRADIVLLDIEMPGADSFEAVAELRRRCPNIRTIILSAHVLDTYIAEEVLEKPLKFDNFHLLFYRVIINDIRRQEK